MDKIHNSKVDSWLMLLVVTLALFVLLASSLLAISGWALLALVLLLLAAVLPMWILMSTRYHIIGDELRVRAGPFRWRIELDRIDGVEPCHNAALAPALSKERLRLQYRASGRDKSAGTGRYVLLLSPEDRYQFIFDLGVADPETFDPETGPQTE
ncbi:PH domain-containing protein [Aliidiomarina soli]|uniref:Uncharacterized protein YyaB-like PH domain-containing protein n=1 Tax=Aliidiomarina soli TaxID=1928574 RepID=A0A432WEB4_9GAMM|nr:PH domain-containing protein [Aliidiomarina soli]RUO31224.1 hypothetical protein CWE14_12075 [Aliidiomarina soli]